MALAEVRILARDDVRNTFSCVGPPSQSNLRPVYLPGLTTSCRIGLEAVRAVMPRTYDESVSRTQ